MPEKKKHVVPRLRFPKFSDSGEWEVKRLGEVISLEYGAALPEDQRIEGPFPVVGSNGIVGYHNEHLVDGPAIVIGRKGSAGQVNWIEDACYPIDTTYYVVLKNTEDHLHFFRLLLERHQLSDIVSPGGVPGLNRDDVYSVISAIPVPAEQQKIADCLGSLDDLIRAEEAALEALKKHKKGLMQRLFPRKGETTPRLRFPEFRDSGEWEVKRLGEVFLERNERNGSDLELLSVTMSDGVVRAADLERKNSASADLSNYKKVYPNDIVYNSMRMWQGASGVSSWSGIVSPAYTVIIPKQNQEPLFWAYYFKLESTIEKFRRYSQGVTSDTWNLKYPAFSSIKLALPSSPDEQLRIANCLASLDDLLRARSKRIEALKQHKKGLMQQLFPQEID